MSILSLYYFIPPPHFDLHWTIVLFLFFIFKWTLHSIEKIQSLVTFPIKYDESLKIKQVVSSLFGVEQKTKSDCGSLSHFR